VLDEAKRELRIGGSEIAAVFDRHAFLDQFGLWARKKGGAPREEGNARMRMGKHLEQGITSYAAEIMHWDYEWCDRTFKSEKYPFMVSTPDALMPKIGWGIDAKLVGWDQAHRWPKKGPPPDHVVMQAWWYIVHFDYAGFYVVVLVMGEDEPRIYPVPRDPDAERAMLRGAERWWKRYLIGDERPPITASDQADSWLKHKYPRNQRLLIDRANDDEADLLDEYAEVRRNHDCVDQRRRDLEAQIKDAIGTRAGLEWPGGKFTWKRTKDSIQTDWEGLASVLLERHPAKEALLGEYTNPKPGVRRIYYKSARGEEVEV
jgi:predicted phage-related endonuclease